MYKIQLDDTEILLDVIIDWESRRSVIDVYEHIERFELNAPKEKATDETG